MSSLQRFLSPVFFASILFAATAAHADVISGSTANGDSFNLYTVTTPRSAGGSVITSVSGSVTVQGITSMIHAVIPTSAPGVTTYTPDGFFYFDNLLFAAPGNPFDDSGVAFTLVDGTEVNLFYNDNTAGSGVLFENNGYNSSISRIQFSPTPEPSGLLLLGSGLAGFAGFLRRRTR